MPALPSAHAPGTHAPPFRRPRALRCHLKVRTELKLLTLRQDSVLSLSCLRSKKKKDVYSDTTSPLFISTTNPGIRPLRYS